MTSIYHVMTSIYLRDMCIHLCMSIEYELYGALHIVCQHVYVHSIPLCAPGGLSVEIPPVLVELGLWVARLVTTRGPGAYWPQYVLIIFLFVGFRSVRYVLQLCGPWAKVAYLYFIYSLCVLHDYECNQILFIVSTSNQYFYSVPVKSVFIISIRSASIVIFVSIDISRFSFSISF